MTKVRLEIEMSEDYIKDGFDDALSEFLKKTKDAHNLTVEALSRARDMSIPTHIVQFHGTRLGMLEALVETLQGMIDDGGLLSIEKYIETQSCSNLKITICGESKDEKRDD